MLKQLYIRDYTLIEKLDITFERGFSVITGETGAGKSIILGAIALLKGQRADSKLIKAGAKKCVIEAHFDLSTYGMDDFFTANDIENDPEDCILRREITAAGKSRAFINDTPVSLALLKELGERLIDVHSQHQNLLLGKQDFQLNVVDIMADDAESLANYRKAYANMRQKEAELRLLKEEIEANKANADFLQYQFDELEAAHLIEGEQEELEQKAERMSHSEDIKTALYQTDNVLGTESTGVNDSLRAAIGALHSIERLVPSAGQLAQRMECCHIELKDIADEVSQMLDEVDFNPADLDAANNRLDKIYELEKKYHRETITELVLFKEELDEKLSTIDGGNERLTEMEQEVDHARSEATERAAMLTRMRTEAAQGIERETKDRLTLLGMPNVKFKISITPSSLGRDGADRVAFLFSANKNGDPQPVALVASGGEIARLMLSLKAMISFAVKLPTIIFDEIDTGVSGKIAEKMAQIMRDMGLCNRQVISITHLPQIAATGSIHYKVYKEDTADGTVSHMRRLTDRERIDEIAQMLSGSDITEAAVNNAKALLNTQAATSRLQ